MAVFCSRMVAIQTRYHVDERSSGRALLLKEDSPRICFGVCILFDIVEPPLKRCLCLPCPPVLYCTLEYDDALFLFPWRSSITCLRVFLGFLSLLWLSSTKVFLLVSRCVLCLLPVSLILTQTRALPAALKQAMA